MLGSLGIRGEMLIQLQPSGEVFEVSVVWKSKQVSEQWADAARQ